MANDQIVQLNHITTRKSGPYPSIGFLNNEIKKFITSYYGKYGFVYGFSYSDSKPNYDINVDGKIICSSIISKMVNNMTTFKAIIRDMKLRTEKEFYDFMFENMAEIYGSNGKYFKNTLYILMNTSRKGDINEVKSIDFFEKVLLSKGHVIKVLPPTLEEDIKGIDGKFDWNGKLVTLQVKPFLNTTMVGNLIKIESQGSLSLSTDYLVLYKDSSYILIRGRDVKIESKYFIAEFSKIIKG